MALPALRFFGLQVTPGKTEISCTDWLLELASSPSAETWVSLVTLVVTTFGILAAFLSLSASQRAKEFEAVNQILKDLKSSTDEFSEKIQSLDGKFDVFSALNQNINMLEILTLTYYRNLIGRRFRRYLFVIIINRLAYIESFKLLDETITRCGVGYKALANLRRFIKHYRRIIDNTATEMKQAREERESKQKLQQLEKETSWLAELNASVSSESSPWRHDG